MPAVRMKRGRERSPYVVREPVVTVRAIILPIMSSDLAGDEGGQQSACGEGGGAEGDSGGAPTYLRIPLLPFWR